MRGAGPAVLLVLLCWGCAQVREVTGGAKDEEGPRLVEASPPIGSVRFTGDRIVLRFNERVQVKRPKGGLLVSPPMDPPPAISVSGAREVTVSWKGELQPNATYSFAVGEAILDLAEGNAARGLTYALSTGDAIDSLSIAGKVANAFTGAAVEDALVMAYEATDTASFTKGRPAFMTRTGKGGHYLLSHLPHEALRVVALRDLNGNYRFDLPAEEIAFITEAVVPSSPSDSLARETTLYLFQEESSTQRILAAEVTEERALGIALALPAERFELRDIAREGGRLTWMSEWNPARDTVLLWPSDTTALSEGRYESSTETATLDTLRYRPRRPMPFVLTVKAQGSPTPGQPLRLRASRPLADVEQAAFLLRADSTVIPVSVIRDPNDARGLLVDAEGSMPQNAVLTLLPKALRDIYGGTHDTLNIAAGPAPASVLGTLRVTIATEDDFSTCILELLDQTGRVVRRALNARPSRTEVWERLEPGNHTLRLIADSNGNGRWDRGRWALQLQPERVILHSEPVNVRAAWDLGVHWKVSLE